MKKRIFFKNLLIVFLLLPLVVIEAQSLEKITADSLFYQFSGVVINGEEGKLPFAVVTVDYSNISTVTNEHGEFSIKIPFTYKNKSIAVSFLGHQTMVLPISSLKKEGNIIKLKMSPFILPELEVLKKDPEGIVQIMLENIAENYSTEDKLMTAFYRETIKKRSRNVSLSEAIVRVYKRAYVSSSRDIASIYKSRKSTDYSRLDTLVLKLMGGPYNNIYIDAMKYPDYLFMEDPFKVYDFEFVRTEQIDDRLIFVIRFNKKRYVVEPLFSGELYIDSKNYALVKAKFDLNLEDNVAATQIFIKKKPFNARISTKKASYLVSYRLIGDKWYYSYSRIDLSFKINWKRKLFNTFYHTTIEMAATDWQDVGNLRDFKKSENTISPTVVIQDETQGFSDEEFWGKYNIIEPDKSIENAIRKIQKQLERTK